MRMRPVVIQHDETNFLARSVTRASLLPASASILNLVLQCGAAICLATSAPGASSFVLLAQRRARTCLWFLLFRERR